METTPLRAQILDTIIRKSTLKQRVFDNTFGAFNSLKETLLEMASEMDDELDGKLDRRVRLEYRDRGKFEAQLQVANDILIFQMHTDVFEFEARPPHLAEPLRAGRPRELLLRTDQHLQLPFRLVQVQPQRRRRLPDRPDLHQPRTPLLRRRQQQTSMRAMDFGRRRSTGTRWSRSSNRRSASR